MIGASRSARRSRRLGVGRIALLGTAGSLLAGIVVALLLGLHTAPAGATDIVTCSTSGTAGSSNATFIVSSTAATNASQAIVIVVAATTSASDPAETAGDYYVFVGNSGNLGNAEKNNNKQGSSCEDVSASATSGYSNLQVNLSGTTQNQYVVLDDTSGGLASEADTGLLDGCPAISTELDSSAANTVELVSDSAAGSFATDHEVQVGPSGGELSEDCSSGTVADLSFNTTVQTVIVDGTGSPGNNTLDLSPETTEQLTVSSGKETLASPGTVTGYNPSNTSGALTELQFANMQVVDGAADNTFFDPESPGSSTLPSVEFVGSTASGVTNTLDTSAVAGPTQLTVNMDHTGASGACSTDIGQLTSTGGAGSVSDTFCNVTDVNGSTTVPTDFQPQATAPTTAALFDGNGVGIVDLSGFTSAVTASMGGNTLTSLGSVTSSGTEANYYDVNEVIASTHTGPTVATTFVPGNPGSGTPSVSFFGDSGEPDVLSLTAETGFTSLDANLNPSSPPTSACGTPFTVTSAGAASNIDDTFCGVGTIDGSSADQTYFEPPLAASTVVFDGNGAGIVDLTGFTSESVADMGDNNSSVKGTVTNYPTPVTTTYASYFDVDQVLASTTIATAFEPGTPASGSPAVSFVGSSGQGDLLDLSGETGYTSISVAPVAASPPTSACTSSIGTITSTGNPTSPIADSFCDVTAVFGSTADSTTLDLRGESGFTNITVQMDDASLTPPAACGSSLEGNVSSTGGASNLNDDFCNISTVNGSTTDETLFQPDTPTSAPLFNGNGIGVVDLSLYGSNSVIAMGTNTLGTPGTVTVASTIEAQFYDVDEVKASGVSTVTTTFEPGEPSVGTPEVSFVGVSGQSDSINLGSEAGYTALKAVLAGGPTVTDCASATVGEVSSSGGSPNIGDPFCNVSAVDADAGIPTTFQPNPNLTSTPSTVPVFFGNGTGILDLSNMSNGSLLTAQMNANSSPSSNYGAVTACITSCSGVSPPLVTYSNFYGVGQVNGSTSQTTTFSPGTATGVTYAGQGSATNLLTLAGATTAATVTMNGDTISSEGSFSGGTFFGVSTVDGSPDGTTFNAGTSGGVTFNGDGILGGNVGTDTLVLPSSSTAVSVEVNSDNSTTPGKVVGLSGGNDSFSNIGAFDGVTGTGGTTFVADEVMSAGNPYPLSFVGEGSGTNELLFTDVATTTSTQLTIDLTATPSPDAYLGSATGTPIASFSGIADFGGCIAATNCSGTTFKATSGATEDFIGAGSASGNLLSFQGLTSTGVAVDVSSSFSGSAAPASGGGSITFSDIETVLGSTSSSDTFTIGSGGETVCEASGEPGDTVNFANSGNTSPTFTLSQTTAPAMCGGAIAEQASISSTLGTDLAYNVSSFIGSSAGSNTFVSDGDGGHSFTAPGNSTGNTLDLDPAVGSVPDVSVNATAADDVTGLNPNAELASSQTDRFSGINVFEGSAAGTTFASSGATGGYQFTGEGSSGNNILNLSNANAGSTITDTEGAGNASFSAGPQFFSDIQQFVGSTDGSTTFVVGDSTSLVGSASNDCDTISSDTFAGHGTGNVVNLAAIDTATSQPLQVDVAPPTGTGSVCYGRTILDATVSGGTTLTDPGGSFTSNDVGATVTIGTGGGATTDTISAVNANNPDVATLQSAITNQTGVVVHVGPDEELASFAGVQTFDGPIDGNTTYTAARAGGLNFDAEGGSNTLSFQDVPATGSGVSINLSSETATPGGGGNDTFSNITEVQGSPDNDVIDAGTGTGDDYTIVGGGGANDELKFTNASSLGLSLVDGIATATNFGGAITAYGIATFVGSSSGGNTFTTDAYGGYAFDAPSGSLGNSLSFAGFATDTAESVFPGSVTGVDVKVTSAASGGSLSGCANNLASSSVAGSGPSCAGTSDSFSNIESFAGPAVGASATTPSGTLDLSGLTEALTFSLAPFDLSSPGSVTSATGTTEVSNFETFVGSAVGDNDFQVPDGGGYTFDGTGSGNTIDLTAATTPATVNVSLSVIEGLSTISVSSIDSSSTDSFNSNIQNFVGSGVATTSFAASCLTAGNKFTGSGSGATLDFTTACPGDAMTINGSSDLITIKGVGEDTFSGITNFDGPTSGMTSFIAPSSTSNLTFEGNGPGNTFDASAFPAGSIIDAAAIVPTATLGGAGSDNFSDVQCFLGSTAGTTTFIAATGLDSTAGCSETANPVSFDGQGTGNELDLSNLSTGSGAITATAGSPGAVQVNCGTSCTNLSTTWDTTSGIQVFKGALNGGTTFVPTENPGQSVIAEGTTSSRTITDAQTGVGSTTLTDPAGSFTIGDVGSTATGNGIPTGTTIVGFTSSTAVTMSNSATATATGLDVTVGHLNTLDLTNSPPGTIVLTGTDTVELSGSSSNTISFESPGSGIGAFVGSSLGDTTFRPDAQNSYSFFGQGASNELDLSQGESPSTVNVSTGSVELSPTASDNFSDISSFLGPTGGETSFFAPATPQTGGTTFTGQGTSNSLSFQYDVTAGLTINLNGGNAEQQTSSRTITDGQTEVGSTTLVDPHGSFTSSDVGSTVTGNGIPGGTTIVQFTSATEVTMSNFAIATATGVQVIVAHFNAIATFSDMGSITGTPEADIFEDGSSNISINGGGGSDTISFANAPAAATANLQTGTVSGGFGGIISVAPGTIQNVIAGNEGVTVTGDTHPSTFTEGTGTNDFILGGGNTTFVLPTSGSGGSNTLSFANATVPVTVCLAIASACPGGVASATTGENTGFGTEIIPAGAVQTLIGGSSVNNLTAGTSPVTLVGGANGPNLLTGGTSGSDTLEAGGGSGTTSVTGLCEGATSGFTSVLIGGGGADTMIGGKGDDLFVPKTGGGSITDTLGAGTLDEVAAAGSVLANLGTSSYTLPSGVGYPNGVGPGYTLPAEEVTLVGQSTKYVLDGLVNIDGSSHGDILIGNSSANTLCDGSSSKTNFLVGGGGGDKLIGGSAINTFVTGSGSNTVIGGSGTDNTIDYSGATRAVNVNLVKGTASPNGYGGSDSLSGIENIVGSPNNGDSLTLGDNPGTITAGNGNDDLTGSLAGDDTIKGGTGNDTFNAVAGGDHLVGGGGNNDFLAQDTGFNPGFLTYINGGGGYNYAAVDCADVLAKPPSWYVLKGKTYVSSVSQLGGAAAPGAPRCVLGDPSATKMTLTGATVGYGAEQKALFSVTVGPNTPSVPTGSVAIDYIDGKVLKPLCTMSLSNGTGHCSPAPGALAPGKFTVLAEYSGSTVFAQSHSAETTYTVVKAGSSTLMVLSPARITFGHLNTVRFSVTVKPQYGGTPSGSVNIYAAKVLLCTIKLNSKSQGFCSVAAASSRELNIGDYNIVAVYPGSALFSASQSKAVKLEIV